MACTNTGHLHSFIFYSNIQVKHHAFRSISTWIGTHFFAVLPLLYSPELNRYKIDNDSMC